jgi:hypothetical protein
MDDLFFDALVFFAGSAIGLAVHGDDILGDDDDDSDDAEVS